MGKVIPFPHMRANGAASNDAEGAIGRVVVADLKHAVDYLLEHYPGQETLMASTLLHRSAELAHQFGTDVPHWLRRVADDIEEGD